MTTATATRAPSPQPVLHTPSTHTTAEQALATVSTLVADLDPRDTAWVVAGPHVTAVVDAVRGAVDGSRSPIEAGEEVAPILRLRDLARTVQRVAGAPGTSVATEDVSVHLAALVEAVSR